MTSNDPTLTPADLQTLLQQAMAHHQAGELYQAEILYWQILRANPEHIDALYLLGVLAGQAGQFAGALELAERALALNPNLPALHVSRGNALFSLQQYPHAAASFDNAIALKPDFAEAHLGRANTLYKLHQYQEAVASFDNAIRLQPTNQEAHSNRGSALNQLKEFHQAIASFDEAIRLQPNFAEAWNSRGNSFYSLQHYEGALASFDRAIALKPDFAQAHNNRGNALNALRRFDAALASFDHALELNPEIAEAHASRGNALFGLHDFAAALESCNRSIALDPGDATAHNSRGNALFGMQQYQAAIDAFDLSIALKPGFAEVWSNRGNALNQLHQSQAAIESYDEAIRIQPDFAGAFANRGNVLLHLQRFQAALDSFDRALEFDPEYEDLQGTRLYTRRYLCDWNGIEEELQQLEARILRGERATIPFAMLTLSNSPEVQQKAAEIFARDKFPTQAVAPRHPAHSRIRIGYYSADFRDHAICYLMAQVFEQHDKEKFELIGFSFGRNIHDEMTDRVAAAMHKFLDVRSLADDEVAQISRDLEVDIAIDLTGFTGHSREGIFAQRAAPIQVSYLGYPGSMGAPFIDYLIGDDIVVPAAARQHYTEKIIALPDCFQAFDTTYTPAATRFTRAEEGLPDSDDAFVFCCFNNAYKISPDTFTVWMRILTHVPNSVLWLVESEPLTAANLRKEAAQQGVSPHRILFARRLPLADHLARQPLADLFLDTLPFNAGATCSPALWAGLPVLTCMGRTFAGRMAGSLLHSLGLPELVTENYTDYEATAIALANDPARYAELRTRLAHNRSTATVFNTARVTQHLEAAYTAIHTRHTQHLPPDHISVPPH